MNVFDTCITNTILLFILSLLKLIFSSENWIGSFAKTTDNQELNQLASQLPAIVTKSRAPSTVAQYSSYFTRWQQWSESHGKSPLPADPYIVSLYYLVHLGNSVSSPAPIISTVVSTSWSHRMANIKDPTKDTLVANTAEGLKRSLSKPKVRKEPITQEQLLSDMVLKYGEDKSILNLLHIRKLAMSLISFAGFLRFNELAQIKMGDLAFTSTHLSI